MLAGVLAAPAVIGTVRAAPMRMRLVIAFVPGITMGLPRMLGY